MTRIAILLFGILLSALGLVYGQQPPLPGVTVTPPGTNSSALTISSPTVLTSGATSATYSFNFEATGGAQPYSWSVVSGTLPPGLALASSGALTGVPTTIGAFTFTIGVIDSGRGAASQSVNKTFTLRVTPGLVVTSTSPINVTLGSALTVILTASGGSPLYLFFVAPGSQLPPGLTLDASSGFLSGTPTTAGTYTFTVNVTDNANNTASKTLVVVVSPPLVITTASTLPSAPAGTAYTLTLEASGGSPPLSWTIDSGTPPPGLALNAATGVLSGTPQAPGAFTIAVRVTDSVKATAAKSITLTFTAAGPGVLISTDKLDFTAPAGGDAAPPQSFSTAVTSGPGLAFTIQIDGGSPGTPPPTWLSVLPLKGTTPARIGVAVLQTGLPAGTYLARILLNTSDGKQSVITVTHTVVTGPAQLEVSPGFLRFAGATSNLAGAEQELLVRNAGGGGPIAFTVSVPPDAPWLSVTPASGQTAPDTAIPLRVLLNAQTLPAGALRTSIHIDSAVGSADIPISLLVRQPSPVIGLSVNGVRFDARDKHGFAGTQNVKVLNLADGVVSWKAEVVTGADWLTLGTSQGQSTQLTGSGFQLSANPSSLAPGAYYALVRVSDPGSLNSPQYLTAVVSVAGADSAPNPQPDPAGLLFVAAAGSGVSTAQPLRVLISSATATPFQASANTADGGTWLAATPASGSTSTQTPGTVNVTVNATGLAPGVYTGDVTFAFSSTLIRSTSITLIVQPAAIAAIKAAAGCTPAKLILAPGGLPNSFATPAGWPSSLAMQLADDCGNAVLNGQVVTTFSNGDPALTMKLTDPGSGIYSATWSPAKTSSTMTLTARAAAPNLSSATRNLTGAVTPNKVPYLTPNAIVNDFNPAAGTALAPGAVADLFGSSLATQAATPGVIPLPAQFNGTSVLIGALQAPLYALSDGQLTVQIPAELAPNTDYSVLVAANGGYALPDSITLSPVQPGLASSNGRASALHAADFSAVTPDSPAAAGEAVILTLVGMGATTPAVASGAAPSSDAPPVVVVQPTVTVGGLPADVSFAQLTPGVVGLYQVGLTVPAGLTSGDQVVVVTQSGVSSNSALLAVQ